MRKSIIIFAIILGLLLAGSIIWIVVKNQKNNGLSDSWSCDNDKNCHDCLKRGGTIFEDYGFVRSFCEIKAKDGGKECIYNDECSKNQCSYKDENSSHGYCPNYNQFDGFYCHRNRDKKISCTVNFS